MFFKKYDLIIFITIYLVTEKASEEILLSNFLRGFLIVKVCIALISVVNLKGIIFDDSLCAWH